MIKKLPHCILLILTFSISSIVLADTDEEIKQKIILGSISQYSGSCPCPYSQDRTGRRCGKRSAYSKPKGYSPICYSSDVTEEMLIRYKKD